MTAVSPRMAELRERLLSISGAYSGVCTWALTDLESGEHIEHDEHAVMPTASLIKVPVLVALYQAAEDGKLRLDDRVRYGPEHRTLGSGVLSKLSFGVEMTVRDAATLMMVISDNSATNMCIDMVGLEAVNALAERLGLRSRGSSCGWATALRGWTRGRCRCRRRRTSAR